MRTMETTRNPPTVKELVVKMSLEEACTIISVMRMVSGSTTRSRRGVCDRIKDCLDEAVGDSFEGQRGLISGTIDFRNFP